MDVLAGIGHGSPRLARRGALRALAGIVAAAPALGMARAASPPPGSGLKISLAQWSLHRALRAGDLAHLDFPLSATRDYGIAAVEYVNSFFRNRAGEADEVRELKRRASDAGVRSLLIMCDGEGAIGDPDDARRQQTVTNHLKWADAAVELGCHSIRVNAQSAGTPEEQAKLAADGLRALTEKCAERGLNCIVENHGGLSSNGAWLAGVIRAVGHPRCGTLPDFGNFTLGDGTSYDRYKGVEEMMPFARAVSAKSHDFDEKGNEVHTDYARMLTIVAEAGYRGFIGVEYEGDRLSEPEGIRATKQLLDRTIAAMR